MKRLFHHKRLQHYKKHYCTTCITGLFGCRWHRYQQSTKETGKVDSAWYIFLLLASIFAVFVLYYWILAGNDYDDFGWYLYDNTAYEWPVYTIMLALTCVMICYFGILYLLSLCHVGLGHEVYMHWVHRVLVILCVLGAIAVLAALTKVYNHGWTLQLISLMITAPFLHLSAVFLVTSQTWWISGFCYSIHLRWQRIVFLLLFSLFLIFLYLSPLMIVSPCICESKDLPKRPKLFTHRGASAIVPENTLEAFVEAATYNHVEAFETDVTVSADGVPFIMHDRTLIRTTNVKQKFPDRSDDCACSFNISEIEELDAGRWFLEKDPHGTLSQLSSAKKDSFKTLKIPRLVELLEVMREEQKKILLDIQTYEYGIPMSHPHFYDYGDVVIRTIQASGVNQSDVLWLYDGILNTTVAHNFTLIRGKYDEVQELKQIQSSWFNVPYYKAEFDDVEVYNKHNASVNVWVVNSKWLYSLYWCMGAHSITTNYVHTFSKMSKPVWHMTPAGFRAMWIIIDILSAITVIAIFILQRIRNGSGHRFRSELSVQNAHQQFTNKQTQRKYMREKLIRGSEKGGDRKQHHDSENSTMERDEARGDSLSIDRPEVVSHVVKMEAMPGPPSSNESTPRDKTGPNEINGLLRKTIKVWKSEAETSLEDVHLSIAGNNKNSRGDGTNQGYNDQFNDSFEHELPTTRHANNGGFQQQDLQYPTEAQSQNSNDGAFSKVSPEDSANSFDMSEHKTNEHGVDLNTTDSYLCLVTPPKSQKN